MSSKTWKLVEVNEDTLNRIKQKYNLSNILSKLIASKIPEYNEDILDMYINPSIDMLYDPFLMKDMDKAVERVIKAIENKEKILIYGDYDVDGVTSTVCLYSFLSEIIKDSSYISYYLPCRTSEGYGLNKEAIDKIHSKGVSLVITVDCGVSAVEEVEYANQIGIDIIITDHHECSNKLPEAVAIIDAKQKGCNYPFKQLAGVGVAFKLISAIAKNLNMIDTSYLKHLDIVALGTIADIVPLISENRIIAKEGMKKINETKNVGLKKLLEISGYNNEIDSIALSYVIAPRINACGRMDRADDAVKLLLETDEKKAEELAIKLNILNKKRQDVEKKILEEAINAIEKNHLYEKEVIVLGKKGWHNGVIGIVASKITELYYKPTILFAFEDDGIGKGSGRSIAGISLYDTLNELSTYLLQFGGHELAAGLSITKENYFEFKEEIEKCITNIAESKQPKVINIDEELTINDINIETAMELDILKPFGQDNQMPIFMLKNIKIEGVRVLGSDKHLKLSLKEQNIIVDAIGFGLGNRRDELKLGDKIDIVFTLEINNFNNIQRVQLNIKDFNKSI